MRESVTSAPNVHAQLRELYRLYRTALMNEKYFGYRLHVGCCALYFDLKNLVHE